MPTKPYKAVVAFIVTFLGTLLATVQGRTDLDTMHWLDWVIVLATTVVATAGVYQVTNPPVHD